MAGLFIWHNSVSLDFETINNKFLNLDYKNGQFLQMANWNVLVFPKYCYKIKNYNVYNDGNICGVGTFSYKGKVYEKALPLIYEDMKRNKLERTAFWGSFIILVCINGVVTMIRDGNCYTRLYSDRAMRVLSTSFAGILECTKSSYTLDKISIIELLLTGIVTGNTTIVNEIKRIDLGQDISGIKSIVTLPLKYDIPHNREEALKQQIEIAKSYYEKIIENWFSYYPNSFIDIGITGGMDSRLSVILALEYTKKVQLHTHWRVNQMKNDDYKYSHIFADETKLRLNKKEITPPEMMSTQDLVNNYEQAYRLSDGVIQSGLFWDEMYNCAKYRIGLTPTNSLRLLGYGGEHYRNGMRFPMISQRSIKSWIKWEMIYQYFGGNVISQDAAKPILNKIEVYLNSILEDKYLNLINYNLYRRKRHSFSITSYQCQIENKLRFCINPFLDTHLSIPSLLSGPFLGNSLSFQLDMMSSISPKLAKIPNGYRFDFSKGEPKYLRYCAALWQLIPPWIKNPLYLKYKNYFFTDEVLILEDKHKFIRDIIGNVDKLNLPINIKKYRLVRNRSKLLLNLGYFIKRNYEKIKYI